MENKLQNKLQIYYQPSKNDPRAFQSLTIKYSEFNKDQNTFKKKIILEKNGEKYKIKKYCDTLDSIKSFLEALDLTKYQPSPIIPEEAYYFIKYGDQTLTTNNPEDIREVLDLCKFDEIMAYDLEKYTKCD